MTLGNQSVNRGYKDATVLTPTEYKVHQLKQQGLSNQQIADAIGSKRTTVVQYVRIIKDKMSFGEYIKS